MKKEKLGFDFDGVLNRLPKPFEIFMRYTSPDDILMRAGLGKLRGIIFKLIAQLPMTLDGRIIDAVPRDSPIISGRFTRSKIAKEKLKKLRFYNFHFRKDHSIHETVFKINKCKELKIDFYFEDRLYVIKRLKANGIKAIDIREVRRLG